MGRENHENETNAFFEENQKKANELKTKYLSDSTNCLNLFTNGP